MTPNRPLYFTIWRWHFYAGLFAIPFLLLLSVTGALYLFRADFEQWRYRDLLQVGASASPPLPHEQIVASVRSAFPSAEIQSYVPASGPKDSAKVQIGGGHGSVHPGAGGREVFVNPYTGQTLGTQAIDDRFMERVKRLHGRLLAGTAGSVLVELASGWMFVLLVTGFYLWFPRANASVWGTLLPRFGAGKRILLRDLHAVGAVYLSLGLCIQILSGQPWTPVSSRAITYFTDSGPAGPNVVRADRFRSQPPASSGGSAQDWLGSLEAANASHVHSVRTGSSQRVTLDEVTAIAEQHRMMRPYQISMPQGPEGVFSVRTLSGDLRKTVYLHMDQYTGEVLASIPFASLKPLAQTVSIGIAFHDGRMWGRANQIFGVVAAAGSFFIAAMGAVLWWSRRPKGQLGGPVKRPKSSVPRGVVWITLLLGVAFPLVGGSILLVWAWDRRAIGG